MQHDFCYPATGIGGGEAEPNLLQFLCALSDYRELSSSHLYLFVHSSVQEEFPLPLISNNSIQLEQNTVYLFCFSVTPSTGNQPFVPHLS